MNSMAGQESVTSVLGPMSGSLSGLVTFTRAILDAKPWNYDPLVPRIPWNQHAYELAEHGRGSNLCFGILMHDEHTVPHPPILRALNMVKEALEKAGHRVIQWQPYKHTDLYEVQVSFVSRD
jgi:amidase